MNAYEELAATGRLGEAGTSLLYRTVRAVALSRNFPSATGVWDADAVAEASHDFLTEERGRRRLSDLHMRAVDEPSFERLLQAAVVNFFRDRSRRTDMGALVRRVNDVCNQSPLFTREMISSTPMWALLKGPRHAARTTDAVLAAAAAEVTAVLLPRWSSEKRRAPAADFASFERMIQQIVLAAAGAVPASSIARAITSRLDTVRVPLTVELDSFEHIPDPQGDQHERVLSRIRADEIFASMSDRQKILLAAWERPVRDLGEMLDVGHSQAAVLKKQLATELRRAVADDDESEQVVRLVRELAARWLRHRTAGRGPTFGYIDEH